MHPAVLSVHTGLATSSRLYSAPLARAQGRQASDLVATLLLLGAGVSAALATVLLDWKLRIPGHAIVRAVFPMALGLALAPRRMGGVVMGAGALGSALALRAAGCTLLGAGALTSLTLTGPFLDAALWRAQRGWQLGAGFALAGLASNLAALVARTGTKLMGLDHPAARPLAEWWLQAVGTYAACGALAGLISALVWFRCAARRGAERSGHTNGSR
jgi:hypothetical protein